jgi:hypothetical protein
MTLISIVDFSIDTAVHGANGSALIYTYDALIRSLMTSEKSGYFVQGITGDGAVLRSDWLEPSADTCICMGKFLD